MLGVVAH
jgi:hypothetical protein